MGTYWRLPVPAQGAPPPGRAPPLDRLDAETCGLCHAAQLADWRGSLHAAAVSAGLLGQLPAYDQATIEDCLNCHAPREEQQLPWSEDEPRPSSAVGGVDCAACHVREWVHHGPRTETATPHGEVLGLTLFREAAFCAPCHQFDETGLAVNGKPLENTYDEWRASSFAAAGVTCQHCHMPGGRHTFRGVHDRNMTRAALSVSAVRQEHRVVVTARNVGAGHYLPTYVTPRITLRIEGGQASGLRQAEHRIERRMAWTPEDGWRELSDTRLPPGEAVSLALTLGAAEPAEVTVWVEPDADYHDRVYPALVTLLGARLDAEARALLERARQAAGVTPYLLYRFICPVGRGEDMRCDEVR
jgi:Cytochrome c554 and c-prime